MKVTKEQFIGVTYDELLAFNDELLAENEHMRLKDLAVMGELAEENEQLQADNAKLREQLERLRPTDCEGNVLDIADTAHMLRSEYDGDHEWEDVVTELVLTKWGGDRWIVRGSKGEAWVCDCTKTGHDEDAYEASDDVEPFDDATLAEAENAKLRELAKDLYEMAYPECPSAFESAFADRMRELGIEVTE